MQKDRAIRDHGDEHVQDPGGTAENKCVNEMGSGAGFPENQKEQENKNAGKATITITGIGAYSGVVKKTFKIQAYKLKADDKRLGGLEEIKGIYDNDGQIKPEPELTFDGKKLIKGKDYTLSYKNYKKTSKGEPQIIIKGKGNFTGKVTMPITVQE